MEQTALLRMTLGKASKVEMIRRFSRLNLRMILKEGYPTLGTIARSMEDGDEQVEKVLAVLVGDLSSSFNNDLSTDQVLEVCAEINSSLLRNLSLEDVYLVCRQVKHADNFGRLTVNKVLKALDSHMDERMRLVEEANYNMHLTTKLRDPDRAAREAAFRSRAKKTKYVQSKKKKRKTKRKTTNAKPSKPTTNKSNG